MEKKAAKARVYALLDESEETEVEADGDAFPPPVSSRGSVQQAAARVVLRRKRGWKLAMRVVGVGRGAW